MVVGEIEKPQISAPTDALIKITSTGICGSDLHNYDGRQANKPGDTIGHEIMGVVEAVGSAVTQIKVGNRVVLPFNISCGTCTYCSQGNTAACLTLKRRSPLGPSTAPPAWGIFRGARRSTSSSPSPTSTA